MATHGSSAHLGDVTISLAGGLGNQLFQLSFAISQAQGRPVFMDWSLGNPRLSQRNLPEICEFVLPENVVLLPKQKYSWLSTKLSNLILRMTSISSIKQKLHRAADLVRFIATKGFRVSTLKRERMISPKGLGFDPQLDSTPGKQFCIGYFQSYRWASNPSVFSALSNLHFSEKSAWLQDIELLAMKEKPIILHLRIGDYENEKRFGRPGNVYYEKAVHEFWQTGLYKKIWIFSDSPDKAKRILPDWILGSARWISNDKDSAAMDLEAMRHGFAYVISNSTFSWWGAFLSYNKGAKVIAPTPWFSAMTEPLEILPPHWVRKPSW